MITFVKVGAKCLAKGVRTTVVLAMSADGKIADFSGSAARFGSSLDKLHLEKQVAQSDGVLFGAGTLRAYGTTLPVTHPDLLHQRQQAAKPLQPVQIVVSRSANLDPTYRFFKQPVPRWLLTTTDGAKRWQQQPGFEKLLVAQNAEGIDWQLAFQQLAQLGINHLAVLGGGELVASLLQADLIDEFKLTICPLVLGGADAPTPAEGIGFPAHLAPRLKLRSAEVIDHEVFLHYELSRNSQ